MNELLQATGYAAIVYVAFNYLISFGSGRPLVEWINPGRKFLPILAVTLIGGAYGSLKVAAARHHETQLELLHDLIGKEQAKPEVVGATSFIVFGVAIALLVQHSGHINGRPFDPSNLHRGFSGLSLGFPLAVYLFVGWENFAALFADPLYLT